jgi:hypothetical protein
MPPVLRKVSDWLGLASGLYVCLTFGVGIIGGAITAAFAAARSVSPAFLAPIALGAMLVLVAGTGGAIRLLSRPSPGRRHYHQVRVSLPAIADGASTIRNVTFDDCDIDGPALVLLGHTNLIGNEFHQGGHAAFLEVRPDQPMPTGLLKMPGCTISNSRVHRVGFVGTAQAIAEAEAGMTHSL